MANWRALAEYLHVIRKTSQPRDSYDSEGSAERSRAYRRAVDAGVAPESLRRGRDSVVRKIMRRFS